MKTIISLIICFVFYTYTFGQGQSFYACMGGNGELLKLDAINCDTMFIGIDSIGLGDIAITPDRRLYGIGGGYLYEIDTLNAQLTVVSHLNQTILSGINALVADSAGNLLTVAHDSLYQINRFTGQSVGLGYIGYNTAGDLTFYNDTLYLVSSNLQLVKVILHPTVSALLIGTMNAPNIYGINTICINSVETMIASGGISGLYSNLYLVNPTNANLTLLCDTISHYLISGAASIYDINGEGGCSIISGVNANLFNNKVEVFPNPFTNNFTVTTSVTHPLEMILYDMASRGILRCQFVNSATINTEHIARGIYFYEVRDKNEIVKRGKLVKDE